KAQLGSGVTEFAHDNRRQPGTSGFVFAEPLEVAVHRIEGDLDQQGGQQIHEREDDGHERNRGRHPDPVVPPLASSRFAGTERDSILDVSRTESAVSGGFSTDYFLGFFVSKTLTSLISRSRTDSPTSSVMNSWNSSAIRTHAGSLCSRHASKSPYRLHSHICAPANRPKPRT